MIKKIYYVWLGGKPLPPSVKSCMKSWRQHCPDWEIIEWNEHNFPVGKYKYVKEAIEKKKYAFASDFIRLWALWHMGGVYCDTDVTILRKIEGSIDNDFVCGIENFLITSDQMKYMTIDGLDKRTGKIISGFGMQTGFMYSEPHNIFVKYCMNTVYGDGQRPFINDDGTLNTIIIDGAMILAIKEFGFKFQDTTQRLHSGITIYNSSVYAFPATKNDKSYVVHWYDQSWQELKGIPKLKRAVKKLFYFLFRH